MAIELSTLSWPNTLTRMVFERLCLVESDYLNAEFKNDHGWFRLVFEQTDFSAYDAGRLQKELAEFYDFAVLDFLEMLDAAQNNPLKSKQDFSLMPVPAIRAILVGNKTEVDFKCLSDFILNHGNTN